MRLTDLPFPTVGGTGMFPLLAERLATRPDAPEAAQRKAVAAPSGDALVAPSVSALVTPPPCAGATGLDGDARYGYTEYTGYTAHAGHTGYASAWPNVDAESRRVLVRSGLWMRGGFVGISLVLAGLIQLVEWTAPVIGGALTLGGAALAAYAWRRAWEILARADADAAGAHAAE